MFSFVVLAFLASLSVVRGVNLRTELETLTQTQCKYPTLSGSPIQDLNRLCVYDHGGYSVHSYQLIQNSNCKYTFKNTESSECFDLSSITTSTCFQPGSTFQLWVNAVAAVCAYVVPTAFQFVPTSTWVQVTLRGGVDNINSQLTVGSLLPVINVSSISACNQGAYDVSSYNLWYTSDPSCPQYSLTTNENTVDLAALAGNSNSTCFKAGTLFNFWVNPVAAIIGSMADYNFQYDPNGPAGVIISGGTVDIVSFSIATPIQVENNVMCATPNAPAIQTYGSSSNVGYTLCNQNPTGPKCNTKQLNTIIKAVVHLTEDTAKVAETVAE